jgi:hypothetical protein
LPLLVAYTHAIALEATMARQLAKDPDYKVLLRWERVCRVMTALCQRLRLSPQSRTPTHTAARPSSNGWVQPANYYETMRLQNSEDETMQ